MMNLSGQELTPDERAFLSEYRVGGVCLFAPNIRDRFQVADYTAELRELCGESLLVAIDQEGGGVLRAHDVPFGPSMMALGAADDLALTREVGAATARGLRAMGVNVDFAPVADVNNNPANPVIADRAFGGEPEHVSRHTVAFLQGMQAEGVAATVKHFPGHGDTDTDSHEALPRLDAPLERLHSTELPPFRAALAAGVAAVMSYHGLVTALDGECPATLSKRVMTGLLRDELGFDGVIFTDALNMRAIADAYGPEEAAVGSLAAGVDMPLHLGPLSEHEGIIKRTERAIGEGRLSPSELERSLQRLGRLARRYPARPNPEGAWRAGDEELLDRAAVRSVVALGGFQALAPNSSLTLVAALREAQGAASDAIEGPAEVFAQALEEQDFTVERAYYDRNAPEEARGVLEGLQGTVLFVSTSRTRMAGEERDFARGVARAAERFIHVALWNPYHALDLPGPALLTFGFRDRSARAAARALQTGEAPGRVPVRLEIGEA